MACPVTKDNIISALNRQYTPQEFINTFGELSIDEVADRYFEAYNTQSRKENLPEPTNEQVNWLNSFAEQIGINVQKVKDITINGQFLGGNGAVLPLQQLAFYVDGQTNALSEELFHVAIELLSQKNPELYNEIYKQITSLSLYKDVLNVYKSNPFYQTNGKPNIDKIKKEAIGKQLTNIFINGENQPKAKSWWEKVIDFLKGLFGNTAKDMKVFQDAVNVILNEDLGTVRNTLLTNENYLKEQGLTDEQTQRVIELANSNITNEELRISIGNLVPQMIFQQVSEEQTIDEYERLKSLQSRITNQDNKFFIDGKEIKKNTTDLAKKVLNSSPEQQAVLRQIENRQESPTYKAVQDILTRYINTNGELREQPLNYNGSELSQENYESLEENILERLNNFPEGSLFLQNVNVYANDTLGNVDLVIITPQNKTNFLTFQEISVPEDTNIPSYETKALRAVLDANRELFKEIGINNLGQTRIIPINRISQKGNTEKIEIGSTTYNNEDNDYLTPIVASKETTGNRKLDEFIKRLSDLTKRIAATNVSAAEQRLKNRQVASLYKGIRELQINGNIRPLLNQSKEVIKKLKEIKDKYSNKNNFSQSEFKSFIDQATLMSQIADTFSELGKVYRSISDGNSPSLKKRIADTVDDIHAAQEDVDELLKENVDRELDKRDISGILNPERIVKFWSRNFRSLSQSATAATQALYRLTYPIRQRIDIEQSEEIESLIKLKNEVETWANSKGIDPKKILNQITKKDQKGRYIHELVDQYSPEFYSELRSAQEQNNQEWVNENIDTKSYNEWFERNKEENFSNFDESTYSYDEEENKKLIEEEKEKWLNTYDISRGISIYNSELKNHPIKDWYSEEYKKLSEEQPLLDLYNYIQSKNNQARELGVLNSWQAKFLIPQIRKDLLEKITFGGLKSTRLGESLFASITINQEDFEYGKIDPITGELKDEIPFYFLTDLSRTVTDPSGEEYQDYSGVSTDIFKVLEAYNKQILKYKYLSEIESTVNAIDKIEKNKKALATDRWGNAIEDGEQVENTENYKYWQNFVKATLYGQRNVGSEWDVKLGVLTNKIGRRINKVAGKEIFSTDYSGNNISLSRTVDAANRFFSLKVLGLNIPVSISNLFGTNFNAWIEAGKFFTKSDFREMEYGILMGKLTSQKDKLQVAAMDYFIPFIEGENNQGKARQLTMSKLNKYSIPEAIMSIQRISDRPVQWGIAGAVLKNTMIENGKFVNIREYLRNTSEYANIYDLPQEQRQKIQASFEQKVKELQDTRSVLSIAEIKEDKFTIPGIDRNSEAVYEFREFIQQLTRNATGMGNQDDIRQINLSLIGRSAMMFKNWIPTLVDRRFSELRYNQAANNYEWGRIKVMMNLIGKGVLKSGKNAYNVMVLNDAGVELLKKEYEAQKLKYESQTGKKFTMSKKDFIEMYSRAVKSELQELGTMMSLLGIFLSAKAFAPDDEDKQVKGFYQWALRVTDKITDELSFFYNPVEWAKIGEGSIFPAVSVVKDATNVTSNILEQGFGLITNNEELLESAKPAKYMMKTFPILKSMTPYMALLLSEAAQKEWGLTPQSELSTR